VIFRFRSNTISPECLFNCWPYRGTRWRNSRV